MAVRKFFYKLLSRIQAFQYYLLHAIYEYIHKRNVEIELQKCYTTLY